MTARFYLHRNRFRRRALPWPALSLCTFAWFLSLLSVGMPLATAQDERPISVQMKGEPILIEVKSTLDPASVEVTRLVALSDKMKDHFGAGNPIIWAPSAKQAPLTSTLQAGGDSLPAGNVSFGSAANSDMLVDFDFTRPHLNEESRFTLRVKDPRKLKPGIYEGNLVSQLRSLLSPTVIEYSWPVVLVVHGRRIVRADFSHLETGGKNPVLRVGSPASVSLQVATVGCDLGVGRLQIQGDLDPRQPSAGQALLNIPLPFSGPLDPEVDVPRLASPVCPVPMCHKQWNLETLSLARVEIPNSNPLQVKSSLFKLDVQLPDCFLMGPMRADLHWQAEDATEGETPMQPATAEVFVLAGIRVFPRIAATEDPITIQLISDEDLGSEIPLVLFDRTKRDSVHEIVARKKTQAGPPFEYRADPLKSPMGAFACRVGDADKKLLAKFPKESSFDVVLKTANNLREPLIVFRGAPPFWWHFFKAKSDGNGWKVIRPNAFLLQDQTATLHNMQVSLKGIFCWRNDHSDQLVNGAEWNSEPIFAVPVPSQNDDGILPVYDPNYSAPSAAPPLALKQWVLASADQNQLVGNLDVQIDETDEPPQEKLGRYILGQRAYWLRFIVQGEDAQGRLVARIVQVPFTVRVATAWQYYEGYLWYAIAAAVVLIVLGIVIWRSYRKVAPAKSITLDEQQRRSPMNIDASRDGSLIPDFAPRPPKPVRAESHDQPAADTESASLLSQATGDDPGEGNSLIPD